MSNRISIDCFVIISYSSFIDEGNRITMQPNPKSGTLEDPIRSEPSPYSAERKPDDLPPPYIAPVAQPNHSAGPKPLEQTVQPEIPYNPVPAAGAITSPSYKWPRHSINMKCPSCEATIKTQVERSSTAITFLIALLLLLVCFILTCVPFCIPACKRTVHYCPNCNYMLGKRKEFR